MHVRIVVLLFTSYDTRALHGLSTLRIFYSYILYCWKMHISAHLIESYPSEYDPWSWAIEKLFIPLEAHDKAQLSENFQVFFQKFKEL